MILISLILNSLGPIVFALMQIVPTLSPTWYYIAYSISGAVNFLTLTFAAASDILPQEMRTAGYGILLGGYYTGLSFAPSLAFVVDNITLAILSVVIAMSAIILACIALPETLPEHVAEENEELVQNQHHIFLQSQSTVTTSTEIDDSNNGSVESEAKSFRQWCSWLIHTATRPIRDMSILSRNKFLQILSAGAFFSSMVHSADQSLVIYYIQDYLNVKKDDIAVMFLVFGAFGIIIQSFLLKPLSRYFGDKTLLIMAFISGTCHNALYGLASNKSTILAALCLSQVTKVNLPLLSSFASRGVSSLEQGRVQGALFALQALGNAIGPTLLEAVYNRTKDYQHGTILLGPGTMFFIGSCMYGFSAFLAVFLPVQDSVESSNRLNQQSTTSNIEDRDLQEPLLEDTSESSHFVNP